MVHAVRHLVEVHDASAKAGGSRGANKGSAAADKQEQAS